jgi:hypothetical protein
MDGKCIGRVREPQLSGKGGDLEGTNSSLIQLFCDMNVGELFIKKFVQQDCPAKTAVSRALQVLSKINYTFD